MKHLKQDILVITTGGTIDSHYNPEEGTPYYVPQDAGTAIPDALKKLELDKRCITHSMPVKDSKDVGIVDLVRMVNIMKPHSNRDKVIITHGTDHMPVNARALQAILKREGLDDKKVVFTGGMEPLRDEKLRWREQADGWTNLKDAFSQIDELNPGVYLAVAGKIYQAEKVSKHVEHKDGIVINSGFTDRISRLGEKAALVEKARPLSR